jgi:hypothetical protein
MANKENKKRRARRYHGGPKFIQLFRYVLDSAAYASLSVWARAALIEVNRAYNGSNNGRIVLSVREVAKRMNCHRDTAARAARSGRQGLHRAENQGRIQRQIPPRYRVAAQ